MITGNEIERVLVEGEILLVRCLTVRTIDPAEQESLFDIVERLCTEVCRLRAVEETRGHHGS